MNSKRPEGKKNHKIKLTPQNCNPSLQGQYQMSTTFSCLVKVGGLGFISLLFQMGYWRIVSATVHLLL
jgi:hypothetical protein